MIAVTALCLIHTGFEGAVMPNCPDKDWKDVRVVPGRRHTWPEWQYQTVSATQAADMGERVKSFTLDALLRSVAHHTPVADMIHLDIEGHELDLVRCALQVNTLPKVSSEYMVLQDQ